MISWTCIQTVNHITCLRPETKETIYMQQNKDVHSEGEKWKLERIAP